MPQDARNVGTQVRTHRTQGAQKIRRLHQDATPTDQTQDPFLLMAQTDKLAIGAKRYDSKFSGTTIVRTQVKLTELWTGYSVIIDLACIP